jgi:hypothetical protein
MGIWIFDARRSGHHLFRTGMGHSGGWRAVVDSKPRVVLAEILHSRGRGLLRTYARAERTALGMVFDAKADTISLASAGICVAVPGPRRLGARSGASVPSATRTSRKYPSTKDSTSMSTLSVWTTSNGSPRETFSPICFSHCTTVASLVVWPRSGNRIRRRISRPALRLNGVSAEIPYTEQFSILGRRNYEVCQTL